MTTTKLTSWKWQFYTISNNKATCDIYEEQFELHLNIKYAAKHIIEQSFLFDLFSDKFAIVRYKRIN